MIAILMSLIGCFHVLPAIDTQRPRQAVSLAILFFLPSSVPAIIFPAIQGRQLFSPVA
jgi:hypothetical protein